MDDEALNEDQAQPIKFVGSKDASRKMLDLARKLDSGAISDEQSRISRGFEDNESLAPEEKELMDFILSKVNDGTIDLYSPSSLLNNAVYEALAEEQRGEIDLYAVNALSTIRRIKDLKDLPGVDETRTYQMKLMINELKLKKEEMEKNFGDVYII